MKNVLKMFGSILLCIAMLFSMSPEWISASASSDNGNGTFTNPVLYADVPDVSVIRVGSTYYMASTTMHLSPGVPIMKSKDLVNWEVVNYVYDRISESDNANLTNGKSMYGKGSWAASLKYNAGTYYCSFMSYTTGKTYIYQTKDIENGSWTKYEISGCYHDQSLLFDTDGRVYMLYGGTNIQYIELNAQATGIKTGGAKGTLYSGTPLVGDHLFEGTQAFKLNGYYYVFNISWPAGKPRTEYCSRSKSLSGPWEHKVVLQTNFDNVSGVAQGGIVDTADGKWYSMMFQDHGAVGRAPVLVPVTWQNDWPVMGTNGSVSKTMTKPVSSTETTTIVKSDEFDGTVGKTAKSGLGFVWQWNHNPDNQNWSLTNRAGYLRLKTGSIASALTSARNTLTQRTYGPTCSGKIAVDVTNMKNGDVAGLSAFCYKYGYVGVKMENGSKKLVMVNAQNNAVPSEIESVNLSSNKVYLKIDFNFKGGDKADFYYSLNGSTWKKIGNTLSMSYSLEHFMGYRFGLFNYATQQTGGYVDFDYFRVSDTLKGACTEADETQSTVTPETTVRPTTKLEDGWYYIKNVNAQKYLQVKDNTGNPGQNVEIGTGSGAAGQKWYLTNTSDGYVTLTSALGSYMIDVASASNTDGANIQIYNGYSGDAQKFALQTTSSSNIYTIATKASNLTKNLDVYNFGKDDGTNVCQWMYGGRENQQWVFEKITSTPSASPSPSPSPSVLPSPSASASPVPTVSSTPSQTPASGIYYDYKIVSDWGSSFQGELTVTNNSQTTYNNWKLTCQYNSTINSLWGAELVSQNGSLVTIQCPSWNTALEPGESVTIDFTAALGNDKNAPVNYSLS